MVMKLFEMNKNKMVLTPRIYLFDDRSQSVLAMQAGLQIYPINGNNRFHG
jgi:hypothetical protein